jgi:GNAT superfamily N-acetyltransferase
VEHEKLTASEIYIVKIADRPDLVSLVAEWLWASFWQQLGYSYWETYDVIAAGTARLGPPQTFVLLIDDKPLGTASLAAQDLDERPELTPWLADVFVVPEARGFGYVSQLITAVEEVCREASITTLWLHTHTAERIYARLGWTTVEYFDRRGQRTALMQRQLSPL